jgi:hypothetical protein
MRWLADGAAALDMSSQLTLEMAATGSETNEVTHLHSPILMLGNEVEALRKGRSRASDEMYPELMY